jgi:hypothetical protein
METGKKAKVKPPRPKRIGTCMSCIRAVYDFGERAGRAYSHGYIHNSCLEQQRRKIAEWNKEARG